MSSNRYSYIIIDDFQNVILLMAQKIAAKFHLRLKKAPDLWWNLDKKYARNLVKKIYDDRFDLRPQTDPDRNFYGDIGKAGLSRSNTFAAIFGYCVVGYHFNIDPVVFSSLVYGTYKCAIAANTYNQKHEITFDRQMERTRIRALVKRGTYDGRYLGKSEICYKFSFALRFNNLFLYF